jgi:predicted phage terminase large subunit-like protein
LRHVQEQLERVTSGELTRLMIFLPPRHGKSEMVTVRYPVWRMEKDSQLKVIVGAYNQILANRFSRKSRRIAAERLDLDPERSAVEEWETAQGGGFRAVGVGGGITGQGGNLIIIDDPVKNREEANSQTYRERVWEWYTDDLYTRLEPGGAIVLIMTRWHEDDLAGRILASELGADWEVVNLPAEAEEGDPWRQPGEALCPDRFDLDALADIRLVLGNSYHALYQQRPQPKEGDFFKRSWFEILRETPRGGTRVRAWDKASTAGAGDYTAGVLMALVNGIYYVEDVVCGQWSSDERNKLIRQTAELDNDTAIGKVRIWAEQEPGSSGKDVAQEFVKMLAGFVVSTAPVTGDKQLRADPFAAQAEAGNVKLKKAAWNKAFLDELTSFPTGAHDDMVDAASAAFMQLTRGGRRARTREY